MDRIVKMGNLAEFKAELPPGSLLRLSCVTSTRRGTSVSFQALNLDLQGINSQGELVWLHDEVEYQLTPGHDEPWTPEGQRLRAAWPEYYALVKAHLAALGYQISGGLYGTADAIRPLRGEFECVQWDRAAGRFVSREP